MDPHFSRASPLDSETRVFFSFFLNLKNHFNKNGFEVENKIRNKNLNVTPCLKKTCLHNRDQIRRSGYLSMVVSCSTL